MKFSTRQDTHLSAVDLFSAITDFDRLERLLLRRGVKVKRVDPAQEPGAGMAWNLAFRLRGKQRNLRVAVSRFDRPEKIAFRGTSDPLELELEMTVIPLTTVRSRVVVEMEVRPRNMRARLMVQTAKLGKSQLDRKFAQHVEEFVSTTIRAAQT